VARAAGESEAGRLAVSDELERLGETAEFRVEVTHLVAA
jgi:hypothetical protein